MIKEDRIHDIPEKILDALEGLTLLEGIGVIETVKYTLLTKKINR